MCCSRWGHKELDTTEWLTELNWTEEISGSWRMTVDFWSLIRLLKLQLLSSLCSFWWSKLVQLWHLWAIIDLGKGLSLFTCAEGTRGGLLPARSTVFFCHETALWVLAWFGHRDCYQTKLGSAHPTHSKTNLLTRGCCEGKYTVLTARRSGWGQVKRTGNSCTKNLSYPMTSGEVFAEVRWGRGSWGASSAHGHSLIGWWWDNWVMFRDSQSLTFGFQLVWGYMLVVSM